jgi:hypothetical protein
MALREVEVLKVKLAAVVPAKRRKVETSPNSRFVNIEAIRRAKIKAGELEAELVDEEVSEGSETPKECIVVASDDDSDPDEVEG